MDTLVVEKNMIRERRFRMPVLHVVEPKKKSYKEACAECGAVTVDSFFDELNSRIDKWPDYA